MKIATVVVLCVCLYSVYALECFRCEKSEDCKNPRKEKCPSGMDAACGSIYVPDEDDEDRKTVLVTQKDCLSEKDLEFVCEWAKAEKVTCYTCKEDGCNEKNEKN